VVLALGLCACLDPIPPDTVTRPGAGEVGGIVTDLCTARPLSEVLVTPRTEDGNPATASQTDAAGRYLLQDLDQGNWRLMFSTTGYQSVQQTVGVVEGQLEPLDVALSPVPTQVPAQVTLDVLFVVDNSNSMAEEQQSLASAFPSFMNTLLLYGLKLDLRVGVISTDLGAGNYGIPSCETALGDGGKLQTKPRIAGCSVPADPFISVVGTSTNVPDDMVNDAFACIVQLGTGGCGFEQPLGAALRAIDGVSNPGFPRQGSALAVVVISDEDDCTAVNTQLYDPSQSSLTDPLGPLTSFRCFEFGVTCDIDDRETQGPRQGCVPRQGGYLLDVDAFVTQLQQGRAPGQVFFGAIAGPTSKVAVGLAGGNPVLEPSCQTASTSAVPAIRLRAVTDRLSPQSAFETICVDNLGGALSSMAQQIAEKTIFSPCGAR